MNNDRFLNTYIEILNSTLHDALGKNIVFQAQAKIGAEDLEECKTSVSKLEQKLFEYQEIEKNITEKEKEIQTKDAELHKLKDDYESVKSETSHLSTFRNELVVARQEIQNKNLEINNLKQQQISEINTLNIKNQNKISEIVSEYETKIKELNDTINYLKLTPAQRRKYDAKVSIIEETKDGGNF